MPENPQKHMRAWTDASRAPIHPRRRSFYQLGVPRVPRSEGRRHRPLPPPPQLRSGRWRSSSSMPSMYSPPAQRSRRPLSVAGAPTRRGAKSRPSRALCDGGRSKCKHTSTTKTRQSARDTDSTRAAVTGGLQAGRAQRTQRARALDELAPKSRSSASRALPVSDSVCRAGSGV